MIWIKTNQNRINAALTFMWVMGIFFSLIKPADAHRVIVFAWVDGDTVHVESNFNGGKKVRNGKVTVTDARGIELLNGATDDNGEFSFSIPKKSELKIILDAGGGHRGEWKIPLEEVDSIATPSGDLNQKSGEHAAPAAEPAQIRTPSADPDNPPSGLSQMELVVEKALDKKLKPIIRMLAETQQKGPTAKDIFAGIGYIVGLVGIAAYIHSRRKKK